VSPSNYGSAFAGATTQVDFIVGGTGLSTPVSFWRQLYLQIQFTNQGANPIRLVQCAFRWFSQIQLLFNGSLVWALNSKNAIANKILTNMSAPEFQSNIDFYAGSTTNPYYTFAAGNTQYFGFNLLYLFPELGRIYLPGVADEIRFRFYCEPAASIVASTSVGLPTDIKLQNMRIIGFGQQLEPAGAEILQKMIATSQVRIPMTAVYARLQTVGPLATGNVSTRMVVNYRGWLNSIGVYTYSDQPSVPEEVITLLSQPTEFTVYNGSGVPAFQGLQDSTMMQVVRNTQYQGGLHNDGAVQFRLLTSTVGTAQGPFSENSWCSLSTPSWRGDMMRHGSFNAVGTESFSVTASGVYTNCQVEMILYVSGILLLTGGALTYQTSSTR